METKSLSRDASLGAKTSASESRNVFFNNLWDKTPRPVRNGIVILGFGLGVVLATSQTANSQTEPAYNQDSSLTVAESNWGPIRLTTMEQALKDCNETLNANKTAKAYFNRGSTLFGMNRYEEAMADFDEAIKLDADYARAYANRGYANLALRRLQEADSDFERAIDLDPKLTKAYVGRGSALNELKLYTKALDEFDKALKLEPNNAPAHIGKGNALVGLKRYKEALKAYERAAELDPKSVPALNGSGFALLALKRYKEAATTFANAAKKEPRPDVQRSVFDSDEDVEPNPEIARSYIGLAEAYKKLRRPAWEVNRLLLEAYKRDLTLDPDYRELKDSGTAPAQQPLD